MAFLSMVLGHSRCSLNSNAVHNFKYPREVFRGVPEDPIHRWGLCCWGTRGQARAREQSRW